MTKHRRDTVLLSGETYLLFENAAHQELVELIKLAICETSEAEVREKTHYIKWRKTLQIPLSALDFLAELPKTDDDWPVIAHPRVRDGCVELLAEVYRRNPERKHLQKYNRMAFENDIGI